MTDFMALDLPDLLPDLTVDPKKLFALKDDPYCISVLLNEFDIKGNKPFFSGLDPSTTPIPEEIRTKKFKELASFMLEVYESFVNFPDWDDVEHRKWAWTHAQQRQVLEKAIRILEKADSADPEVMLWMGKAYLYRSRIIRPKGFTIPAKKTESLFKSLDYCLKSTDNLAAHYAGLVALELDRCGKPRDNLLKNDYPGKKPARLRDLLNNATAQKPSDTDDRIVGFYQMRIRLEEFEKPLKYDDKSIFNVDKNGLELEKFKVALLLDNEKIDECRKALLIQLSRSPFSHHLWEDTVKFTRRLYDEKNPKWKDLAIKLWKKAEAKSIRTTSVHLRWYWSRQRNLYDLAFLAAIEMNNIRLAAKIADSAKSRPALTWQAMERMAVSDDIIKKEIEWNSNVLSKVYIKDLDTDKTKLIPESEFPEKLDTSAIVVQFYLVHLHEDDKKDNAAKHAPAEKDTKHGYALIFDDKKWKYDEKFRFDFKPLWDAYLQWRSAYDRASQKFTSAKDLQSLCLELGKQLKFLFEFENNRQMIFIPHDFLHRLPLHGAMADEKTILLEKFKCTYLPALCYARKSEAPKQGGKSVLLQYFDPEKDEHFIELFKDMPGFFNEPVTPAGFEDIRAIAQAKESPGFLTFLCHGEADYINPFFSRLKLKEDVKLSEFAALDGTFAGTGIFLSACETDLMPPIDSPLDEHLSLASIFLNKEASFVLGTMWEFYPVESNVLRFLLNIRKLGIKGLEPVQKSLWNDYKKGYSKNKSISESLYHCLCYKLFQVLE